jgi:restriction endonuclease S subunit
LKGQEISEVNFKTVLASSYSQRIDSSFFQQEFLEAPVKPNSITLSDLCLIRSGTTPSNRDATLEEGVILLKTDSVRNSILQFTSPSDFFFIDEETDKNMRSTSLQNSDVLMNIVGATTDVIGRCSLLSADFPKANITQAMVLLRVRSQFAKLLKPEYLFSYLTCKFGHQQVRRNARPTGQFNMNQQEVGSFQIPVVGIEFQSRIATVLKESERTSRDATETYTRAESVLLEHLGLTNYTPSQQNTSSHSFKNSFLTTGRLDAEYYEPKFDELETKLRAVGNIKTLDELVPFVTRGTQPTYTDEIGVVVVNSKHVREDQVIVNDNRYGIAEDDSLLIRTGDVLMNGTGVGTIGRCAPYLHPDAALPDNHVTILRPATLDPVYLSVYLGSIAGQLQVEKFFKGSSGQIELYPTDIREFLVWEAPETVQKTIRQNVEQAHQARQKSQVLLELAKRAVEIAIENDEDTASTFIRHELERLGITLEPDPAP